MINVYKIQYTGFNYSKARKVLMHQIGQNRFIQDEWVVDHGNNVKTLCIAA